MSPATSFTSSACRISGRRHANARTRAMISSARRLWSWISVKISRSSCRSSGPGFCDIEPKADTGVGLDGRQRLIDLVRDGRDELPDQREARGVSQIQPRRAQFIFGVLALGDVAARVQDGAALDRDPLDVNQKPAAQPATSM